jgi:hypothetical protein
MDAVNHPKSDIIVLPNLNTTFLVCTRKMERYNMKAVKSIETSIKLSDNTTSHNTRQY